jgi:RimJ/RimL family protein N-acetyltransferase
MTDRIETPRLILRPIRESETLALAHAVNNRRIVRNTARIPWPYTLDDARDYWRQVERGDCRSLRLSIFERARPNVPAGGIGYECDVAGQAAELGYWLAEPVWAKGYGYEAAAAVTAHAFERAGLDRLVAGYRHGNEASRRILDRLGFRHVGHMDMYSRGAGRFTPTARLELTRREWLRRTCPKTGE